MFVPSRAGRTDCINILAQRWAYNEAAKSVCKGCFIIIVIAFPGCDFLKQFLNMPGEKITSDASVDFFDDAILTCLLPKNSRVGAKVGVRPDCPPKLDCGASHYGWLAF